MSAIATKVVNLDRLAHLPVSTMTYPEICEYPDSGKVAAFGGSGEPRLRHVTGASSGVDYWKGEE